MVGDQLMKALNINASEGKKMLIYEMKSSPNVVAINCRKVWKTEGLILKKILCPSCLS